MGDSNRDSENTANPTEEDPPPILSNGIREVFHIFASMLDVKSFMKLAMASKETYKRCMEDTSIKIHVEENEVTVRSDLPSIRFHSFEVADIHIEKYLKKLRQLKCNVSLKTINFTRNQVSPDSVVKTRCYLEELGVKKIDSLWIYGEFTGLQEASFIKDFNLQTVDLEGGLPDDALRSLLQLNLDSLFYQSPVQGEILLQVDSPILRLELLSLRLSSDVFTQILWKIQTGSLKKLITDYNCVPWNDFTKVTSDFNGPLPPERPLRIGKNYACNWFLHWHGEVTKCEYMEDTVRMVITKCDPQEFPALLNSEETVHKALAEKRPITCFKQHFVTFFEGYRKLESSHEGPFPERRPLLFKISSRRASDYFLLNEDGSIDEYTSDYFLLNEDGSIDEYIWNDEKAVHRHHDMINQFPSVSGHFPLQKYVVEERVKKRVNEGFDCENVEIFRRLFTHYKTKEFDYKGRLPERRPLVFYKTECRDGNTEYRIVLHKDGSLTQYSYVWYARRVEICPCPAWNRPTPLLSAESVKEILQDAPFERLTYNIGLNMFRDAFKEFTTLPFYSFGQLPLDYPIVFKRTEKIDGEVVEHRWFVQKKGIVRKCEWKDGQATFGVTDTIPPILVESLIKGYFKGEESADPRFYFKVDRDVLNDYLEEFEIIPYDHPGPLPENRPLIFQKSEIKHTCSRKPSVNCSCNRKIRSFWLLSHSGLLTYSTWKNWNRLWQFYEYKEGLSYDLPPLLKTKDALDYLLKKTRRSEGKLYWYCSWDDFCGYFESHAITDFNVDVRLPSERPLVFKTYFSDVSKSATYWFLREDNVLIECDYGWAPSMKVRYSTDLSPLAYYFSHL